VWKDPKQQWTKCTVISWHPACLHWNGETWTGSSEQSFHLLLK